MVKLSILIPTYNRVNPLMKNLLKLTTSIRQIEAESTVEIVVLNNASKDSTIEDVEMFISTNIDIDICLYSREKTVHMIDNIMGILEYSTAKHILYLGDDDYIDTEYLRNVVGIIHNDSHMKTIVPSYQNILENGEKTGIGRDIGATSKSFNRGFRSALALSWKGHQLSGLVFERKHILEESKKYKIHNYYPFIFYILVSTNYGTSYLLTEFPVLVTRPGQEKKAWGYGKDGLIQDIFANYKDYKKFNYFQRCLLQIQVLDKQYWRYAMYLKKTPFSFLQSIWQNMIGSNTLFLIRILFPFLVIIIGVKKTITFLLTGKLVDILSTKVDI